MFHTRATTSLGRLSLTLIMVLTAAVGVWAQTASSERPQQNNNSEPAAQPSSGPLSQTTAKSSASGKQQETTSAQPKKPKRGQLIIAPIPITSPAVGRGLVLAVGYVFRLNQEDKKSPPSTVGLVGAFTSSGTRGGGIGGRLYFSENKYQTTFVIAKGRVDVDFYGIGRIPGKEAIKVPIRGGGTVFFGEFMRNVWKDIFVGPRYQHRKIYTRLDGPQTPGGFEIPPIDLQATTVALGFHLQRDKRDSTFYPTKGSLFDATGDFFDESLGSKRQYQNYKIEYNGYREVANKQVLAYRGMICSANQNVPFYDLCLFGVNNDLRGYTGGQFQNRRMFATQAEYRRELTGRFGVVAFGGFGGIANRWSAFRSDELLPAAGAGLRFKLDKKNHINYRVDFAVGRDGHTLSIGVGEAF
jgi:surface antigen Omp85-like protein